ncbi:hypothetical protein VU08_06035 [Desulfobulbus sp. F5]|nr:hypothetical protein [Desulfobulbus sp. F5]
MTTREDVKKKAVHLLAVVANMPEREGEIYDNEELSLSDDLLLAQEMIGALAVSYTKISQKFGGDKVVLHEAVACKTVKNVIDLILSKIPKGAK